MDIEGHDYIRRISGVDVERQCFDLRILAEGKDFRLRGPVFVPHMRHLSGSLEVVRLFAPVCSVQPWQMLERRPVAALAT